MPNRRRTSAALRGFLYGAGSVGDLAGARLPAGRPIRPSGGFAVDAAKLFGDGRALGEDGRRAAAKILPPEVVARVGADR